MTNITKQLQELMDALKAGTYNAALAALAPPLGNLGWSATDSSRPMGTNPCAELDIPKIEGCPICGHAGNFVRMSLMCPHHGVFGGC